MNSSPQGTILTGPRSADVKDNAQREPTRPGDTLVSISQGLVSCAPLSCWRWPLHSGGGCRYSGQSPLVESAQWGSGCMAKDQGQRQLSSLFRTFCGGRFVLRNPQFPNGSLCTTAFSKEGFSWLTWGPRRDRWTMTVRSQPSLCHCVLC